MSNDKKKYRKGDVVNMNYQRIIIIRDEDKVRKFLDERGYSA